MIKLWYAYMIEDLVFVGIHNYKLKLIDMRGSRVPQILRNATDRSITLWYQQPKYSLLWLHGLGDEAESFVPYFAHLQSPIYHHCRVKILQAPSRYVSVNQGETNAWFDLKSVSRFTIP